jgi:hypothetical protein
MRYARTLPRCDVHALCLVVLTLLLALTLPASRAAAQSPATATWQLEQPSPPNPPGGKYEGPPIGLGRVGDIEFWAPNRGLLITAGNGSTIPSGVWVYNGREWHQLATVCGATEGRIAWAGPEEFWTISNGRPGQATNPANGETAPILDNTLCHFAPAQPGGPLAVVSSYASPAFQPNSYQPMHAAGCIGPSDCWFAGEPLPEPQIGAFQLHWNGSTMISEPDPQGHAVRDMRLFGGRLYESLRLAPGDLVTDPESPLHPPVLRRINPAGVQPTFVPLSLDVPEYASGEFPTALDYLRLSADAEALWGAAGPASPTPEGSIPAEVAVVRYAKGSWNQVVGPAEPPHENPFKGYVVTAIAAEPGSESAWVGLDMPSDAAQPSPLASAIVAHVAADGTVLSEQTLPTPGEAPKGAAEEIACPAAHDCWMVSADGWLFHLHQSGESQLPLDTDSAFTGPITYRPPDEGLPQVVPDAPPVDDSGLVEEPPVYGVETGSPTSTPAQTETVALLSGVYTRVLHRTMLELRFKLAVKARVRLVAKRRKNVVASTSTRTLPAGEHRLLLRLDARRWPTKLDLQTHALAPLPTVVAAPHAPAASNTITTDSLAFPNARGLLAAGPLSGPLS